MIDLRPYATSVSVADGMLTVSFKDGRTLSAPLAWFLRLVNATPEQRAAWRLIGDGEDIHWEAIDEDISVPRLLGLPCK